MNISHLNFYAGAPDWLKLSPTLRGLKKLSKTIEKYLVSIEIRASARQSTSITLTFGNSTKL